MAGTGRRVIFFDVLRGFMLVNMVVYHLLYDVVYLVGRDIPWYHSPGAQLWQEMIACTFIALSGVCCCYSKNNLKRGAVVLWWAAVLTAVTYFIMPEYVVVFGVLHCLGICMLLFPLLRNFLAKIPVRWGVFGCIVLYCATGFLQTRYFSVNLFPLGIRPETFRSSDYIPLLPYIFVFLAGTFLGRCTLPAWMYDVKIPPLTFLGRYSLWVYLLHQPVLYLLVTALWR